LAGKAADFWTCGERVVVSDYGHEEGRDTNRQSHRRGLATEVHGMCLLELVVAVVSEVVGTTVPDCLHTGLGTVWVVGVSRSLRASCSSCFFS
jgi:hypothetical protein